MNVKTFSRAKNMKIASLADNYVAFLQAGSRNTSQPGIIHVRCIQ